jgi:flagellar biosynthesis GTPase FlhF
VRQSTTDDTSSSVTLLILMLVSLDHKDQKHSNTLVSASASSSSAAAPGMLSAPALAPAPAPAPAQGLSKQLNIIANASDRLMAEARRKTADERKRAADVLAKHSQYEKEKLEKENKKKEDKERSKKEKEKKKEEEKERKKIDQKNARAGKTHKRVTAKTRASEPEYKDLFRYDADNNTLICRACELVVDWERKGTLDDHLRSKKHKKNIEKPVRLVQVFVFCLVLFCINYDDGCVCMDVVARFSRLLSVG